MRFTNISYSGVGEVIAPGFVTKVLGCEYSSGHFMKFTKRCVEYLISIFRKYVS